MSKYSFVLIFLLFFPLLLLANESIPSHIGIEKLAKEFVVHLSNGRFAVAEGQFDSTMTKSMPPGTLKKTWLSVIDQAGNYASQQSTRHEKMDQFDIVVVICKFDRVLVDIKVVFDKNRKVAGLFFSPSHQASSYEFPYYVRPDSFYDKDVVVGTGKWSLPGALTIPTGNGPFPGAVLVHGSGPLDRDSTIGPNKPFRDLALGLASRGIAVLCYEKRTRQHSDDYQSMKDTITVEEETVIDALKAVSLLRGSDKIDKNRIFVIGHSLGGMLIPRIASRVQHIAGFVIMAGNNRPLEDVIYAQYEYLLNQDTTHHVSQKKQLDDLAAHVRLVKSDRLTEKTPSNLLPLYLPASYWLDLKHYDPVKEAAKIKKPVLILQGEKDYQVTMDDFHRWKQLQSYHHNIRCKSFSSLNHLFIVEEGKSTPSSYEIPGHVHESVVSEIASFIKQVG